MLDRFYSQTGKVPLAGDWMLSAPSIHRFEDFRKANGFSISYTHLELQNKMVEYIALNLQTKAEKEVLFTSSKGKRYRADLYLPEYKLIIELKRNLWVGHDERQEKNINSLIQDGWNVVCITVETFSLLLGIIKAIKNGYKISFTHSQLRQSLREFNTPRGIKGSKYAPRSYMLFKVPRKTKECINQLRAILPVGSLRKVS